MLFDKFNITANIFIKLYNKCQVLFQAICVDKLDFNENTIY